MDAISDRSGIPAPEGGAPAGDMDMKWAALHDAAGVVATLAGIESAPMTPEIRGFPGTARDAGGWRRKQAEEGIQDLAAVMEPGIAALLAVHARGADPSAAALALWQEFDRARQALLALAPTR